MMRVAAGTLAVLFLCPSVSAAHRLDEYLQATRIAVDRDRIALEIDLTPGATIAPAIVALIDRSDDGRITPSEAEAYGTRVLTELVLLLDGRQLPLTLNAVDIPPVGDMREGMGSIRIKASAIVINAARTGRHLLYYRNDHAPNAAVYLVNALMPDAAAISIGKQRRDERQREFRVEYDVTGRHLAVTWALAAVLMLGSLTMSRIPRRRLPRTQFLSANSSGRAGLYSA